MAGLVERMIGAAKLDAATYEEVEADRQATGQAALVVALASVAGGLGTIGQGGMRSVLVATLVNLLGWVMWAAVTYVVGTRLLPGPRTQADLGELLRTIGFSSAPGVLNVAGVIPGVGRVVAVVVSLWMLAAMVVAVRQALDFDSTGRAVAVCVVGFIVYLAAAVLLLGVLELTGAVRG